MCRYVDMKCFGAAPKSRRSIAEGLTTVAPALLATTRGAPDAKTLRLALLGWVLVAPVRRAFSAAIRETPVSLMTAGLGDHGPDRPMIGIYGV
jgi:hypothetical protein